MDRKTKLGLALLSAFVVLVGIFIGLNHNTGSYAGKPLDVWLRELDEARTEKRREHAVDALGQIVTNSPASLVQLIGVHYSPTVRSLRRIAAEKTGLELGIPAREVRIRAFDAFEALGVRGAPTVPKLLERLKHPNPNIRQGAARALESVGKGAIGAELALIEALSDGDDRVAESAAKALEAIGPPTAAIALPSLKLILADVEKQNSLRQACAKTIGSFGSLAATAVPELLLASRDKAELLRVNSIRALGLIAQDDEQAFETVFDALRDPKSGVRVAALETVSKFGTRALETIPLLLEMAATDKMHRIQHMAVRTIRTIKPLPEWITIPMIHLWGQQASRGDSTREVQAVLKQIGPPCFAHLVPQLENENSAFVIQILSFLGDFGAAASEAAQPVSAILGAPDLSPIHVQAASSLHKIAPSSPKPLLALLKALQDRDPQRRAAAIHAMGGIRPLTDEALGAMIESVLNDDNESVRYALVFALGERPEHRTLTVPPLTELVSDEVGIIRATALRTLFWSYGKESLPSVSQLITLLDDPDDDVRAASIQALGVHGPTAQQAIPKLIEIVSDVEYVKWRQSEISRQEAQIGRGMSAGGPSFPNPAHEARENAVEALGRIGSDGEIVVPLLINALDSRELRKKAIMALGRYRKEATSAVPLLSEFLEDGDGTTSSLAEMALILINPDETNAVVRLIDYAKKDEGNTSQYFALAALELLGREAVSSIPFLQELVETTKYESVRRWTARALSSVRK